MEGTFYTKPFCIGFASRVRKGKPHFQRISCVVLWYPSGPTALSWRRRFMFIWQKFLAELLSYSTQP